jgi:nitroreductase
MVYAPTNLQGCQVAIGLALTSRATFDAGRCAQNMMLAAWAEGIGSAPNGLTDAEAAGRLLGMPAEENLVTILSFGYPLRPYVPRPDDIDGILQRVKRKPLDEIVVWVE